MGGKRPERVDIGDAAVGVLRGDEAASDIPAHQRHRGTDANAAPDPAILRVWLEAGHLEGHPKAATVQRFSESRLGGQPRQARGGYERDGVAAIGRCAGRVGTDERDRLARDPRERRRPGPLHDPPRDRAPEEQRLRRLADSIAAVTTAPSAKVSVRTSASASCSGETPTNVPQRLPLSMRPAASTR